MSSASTGNGRSACAYRVASPAHGLCASIFSGVARRPASHVRYDSGETHRASPRTPPATGPARSGIHAAYGAPRRSHHAIGAGRCEARDWGSAYFSQPIFGRSTGHFFRLYLRPRNGQASGHNRRILLGKWRARQDSNLRPSGLEGRCSIQLSYGRGRCARSNLSLAHGGGDSGGDDGVAGWNDAELGHSGGGAGLRQDLL